MTRSRTHALLGVQEPQIVHRPPDVHSLDGAREAIEFVEAYGMTPDANQVATVELALGEREDFSWAAFEVCDVEPRQNGKGDKIQIREAAGMFVFDEGLIIHTAHELKTAVQAFRRMEHFISRNADLRRQVKFRYANGEQAVEHKSGARIIYLARTGGAGRGFDDADVVIYDEAYALQAEQAAASISTMSVAVNPQVWYASSAGKSDSTMLWALRMRALQGDAGRLAYSEHTAETPRLELNDDGELEVVSPPVDPYDERNIALANPAYGYRISSEFVDGERRAFSANIQLFLRERCGVFDPLPKLTKGKPAKLPAEAWAATVLGDRPEPDVEPGEVTIGYDVSLDGKWSSIAIGFGTQAAPYVELIEHEPGSGYLPARLVELCERWEPIAVGCNGAGPAGATLATVREAFAEAGLADDLLHELKANEYKQACGGLYTTVLEGTLQRPNGQDDLDDAAGRAAERTLGDAWAWDVRQNDDDISPVVAVTVARALLPVKRKRKRKPLSARS